MENSDVKAKLNDSENVPESPNEMEVEIRYGWGKFRPKILQIINGPKWFTFFLAIFSMTQGKKNTFIFRVNRDSTIRFC